MAITGHKTRAVFDRYGIQPEGKLREAIENEKRRCGQKADSPAGKASNARQSSRV